MQEEKDLEDGHLFNVQIIKSVEQMSIPLIYSLFWTL